MLNHTGAGGRVLVLAAAARVGGQAVVEEGFHGFVIKDAASGAKYWLDISETEKEVGFLNTATRGAIVYITTGNVLTLTASTNRAFGKVTEVQGVHGVPTGKMRVKLFPQPIA